MHLVLIRHGEPDYRVVTERKFKGHGRDLAPLTEQGVLQAEAVSHDPRLAGAEFIVSSPYTRALQTAAMVTCNSDVTLQCLKLAEKYSKEEGNLNPYDIPEKYWEKAAKEFGIE